MRADERQRVSVYLPDDELEMLREMAVAGDRTTSRIVRFAVRWMHRAWKDGRVKLSEPAP